MMRHATEVFVLFLCVTAGMGAGLMALSAIARAFGFVVRCR